MTEHTIGLTGPTGAGKGLAAEVLRTFGCLIIDTDALVHEVQAPGSPCVKVLAAAFSPSVMREDGSLNRAALAALAFATPEAQAQLNAIVHPYIIARTQDILTAAPARWAVIDAPLLFESGMDALCNVTVAVLAPTDIRRARIVERDGLSTLAATQRMQAQPPDDFYVTRADTVLYNDGDKAAFCRRVADWAETFLKEANA